jgi:hypothetical protein
MITIWPRGSHQQTSGTGIEELALGEAAAALDIPIGTLMSRTARARETSRAMGAGARRQNLRIVGGLG